MSNEHPWERIEIGDLAALMNSAQAPWWVAGGLAIDLFLGFNSRPHEDLDIVINRDDQRKLIDTLKGWDLRETNPPGVLNPLHGNTATKSANAIWCREDLSAPWRFELLLTPFSPHEWIYRRILEIRGPIDSFGWRSPGGFQVISPEIQLLYKSKARRPKDEIDFQNCVPVLSKIQKKWLKDALEIEHGPQHPWLEQL